MSKYGNSLRDPFGRIALSHRKPLIAEPVEQKIYVKVVAPPEQKPKARPRKPTAAVSVAQAVKPFIQREKVIVERERIVLRDVTHVIRELRTVREAAVTQLPGEARQKRENPKHSFNGSNEAPGVERSRISSKKDDIAGIQKAGLGQLASVRAKYALGRKQRETVVIHTTKVIADTNIDSPAGQSGAQAARFSRQANSHRWNKASGAGPAPAVLKLSHASKQASFVKLQSRSLQTGQAAIVEASGRLEREQAERLNRQQARKLQEQSERLNEQQARKLQEQAERLNEQQERKLQEQAVQVNRQQARKLQEQSEQVNRQQARKLQEQAEQVNKQQARELQEQGERLNGQPLGQQQEEKARQAAELSGLQMAATPAAKPGELQVQHLTAIPLSSPNQLRAREQTAQALYGEGQREKLPLEHKKAKGQIQAGDPEQPQRKRVSGEQLELSSAQSSRSTARERPGLDAMEPLQPQAQADLLQPQEKADRGGADMLPGETPAPGRQERRELQLRELLEPSQRNIFAQRDRVQLEHKNKKAETGQPPLKPISETKPSFVHNDDPDGNTASSAAAKQKQADPAERSKQSGWQELQRPAMLQIAGGAFIRQLSINQAAMGKLLATAVKNGHVNRLGRDQSIEGLSFNAPSAEERLRVKLQRKLQQALVWANRSNQAEADAPKEPVAARRILRRQPEEANVRTFKPAQQQDVQPAWNGQRTVQEAPALKSAVVSRHRLEVLHAAVLLKRTAARFRPKLFDQTDMEANSKRPFYAKRAPIQTLHRRAGNYYSSAVGAAGDRPAPQQAEKQAISQLKRNEAKPSSHRQALEFTRKREAGSITEQLLSAAGSIAEAGERTFSGSEGQPAAKMEAAAKAGAAAEAVRQLQASGQPAVQGRLPAGKGSRRLHELVWTRVKRASMTGQLTARYRQRQQGSSAAGKRGAQPKAAPLEQARPIAAHPAAADLLHAAPQGVPAQAGERVAARQQPEPTPAASRRGGELHLAAQRFAAERSGSNGALTIRRSRQGNQAKPTAQRRRSAGRPQLTQIRPAASMLGALQATVPQQREQDDAPAASRELRYAARTAGSTAATSAFAAAPATPMPMPALAHHQAKSAAAKEPERAVQVEAPKELDPVKLEKMIMKMPQLNPEAIADQVYKALERKMKLEQRRRGL